MSAVLDRDRAVAEITVPGPDADAPASMDEARAPGAAFWTLAMARELDDLILDLRTNEPEIGTWVLRTAGDAERASCAATTRCCSETRRATGWPTRSCCTSSAR